MKPDLTGLRPFVDMPPAGYRWGLTHDGEREIERASKPMPSRAKTFGPARLSDAVTPIVRATRTVRAPMGGRHWIVRGRLYEACISALGDVVVIDEARDSLHVCRGTFVPANAAARRLMRKPVSPEVRRFKRRAMKAIRDMLPIRCIDDYDDGVTYALTHALAAVAKVRP